MRAVRRPVSTFFSLHSRLCHGRPCRRLGSSQQRRLDVDFITDPRQWRPSPNLRLDTRFLDARTPRLRRATTRSQESLTGYPYLDSPHTHPDLRALPTDTPPSTPIVFQYPPPSPVPGGVDDEDAVDHEDVDRDIGIARSDSDALGLQRRGTATRTTVRVRRERFLYVLRPMDPGPLSAPPLGQSKSKSRSKAKVFQAFVVPVDEAGEWTGEWNQVDMQEVIKKLRGLH
ncbi:hypothetical protein FB45DRAFT_930156 [Roridomyces roridus]|uniref:Uncharacterized protein n=1 Tax=Roridomyces roridus TaxID=1738132 RepID=A0AAD7BGJ1_9AGAR|nr:hypothetical protein FB45DRAFT_930156 [Roridomyces roridus]